MFNMPVAVRPTSSNVVVTSEALEKAAKEIDRQLNSDRQFPDLCEQLRVASHVSFSGVNDYDYPNLSAPSVGLAGMEIIKLLKMVPLPAELVEQFDHMQCNCMMGLFPEIRRAWLTIDSDIFVWNYEDGSDLAFFDGLSETILGVGLVTPKPGALQDYVKYVLCLTTPVDIVLLGVTFSPKRNVHTDDDEYGEMHLQPDPLFSIPSDNIHLPSITGTLGGRIFMGGKDACVYEVVYQTRDSWFQKKCRKINHSSSTLSMLMPSFLNLTFSGEDAIVQLAIDNTRNTLFSRSERGTIQVFDLGDDGQGMSYVAQLDQENIAHKASAAIRTFDYNHFKPIVHIAPISAQESQAVHLVAITQTGARLYFSTTHLKSSKGRPSRLNLLHVRMPPGYAPSATPQRPSQIHAAFYRQGVALMSGSETDDRDVLWGISPDPFPFHSPLKEMQVAFSLEGRTWALAEIPNLTSNLVRPSPVISDTWPDPPAVVKQHFLPPRTFVVLSAQGSCLLTSYRPAEQLRQLLVSSGGFDSEAVQSFFKLHKEDQACAICLVLACSMQATEQQVAEWATRSFFKYGGESQYVGQPLSRGDTVDAGVLPPVSDGSYTQGSLPSRGSPGGSFLSTLTGRPATSSVAPATENPAYATSTPHPGVGATGRAVFRPEVMKSGKHDGLCLYIARILGTIWDGRLVEDVYLYGHQDSQQAAHVLRSRFTCQELGWFLERLTELKTWMENNMQFSGAFFDNSLPQSSLLSPGQSLLQRSHQEAFAAEKSAVAQLKMLVDRCCEALALWELLCEHQFELVIDRLDPVTKEQVRFMKFKELVLPGQETCSALISSLMNQYLDDKTSVDAISERLRTVCPSVYSSDDAVCTKAGELLSLARRTTDKYDQQRILKDSLQYYRQVTHQINLEAICAVFESVRFTEGIVELCLYAALKRDPQGLALHFYKIDQPPSDTQGQEAFAARQYCYNIILDVLQRLLVVRLTPAQSSSVPKQPGPPPAPDPNSLTPVEAENLMEATLKMALSSSDELWHMCLYTWLIENSLKERLLEIKSPHLETFLKSSVLSQPANELEMLDLLWRYYEKTKNYSAAARVLTKLAEREGLDLTLERRLEYLSRAIMSAKSSNLRTTSSTEGEFLHELEEKLEVARIQLQIYEALTRMQEVRHSARVEEARQVLSSRLMDITALYGDFADLFTLSECKLAIVHCAGHYDPALIETLWREIIYKELEDSTQLPEHDRITVLSKKMTSLGKTYVHSERYFPLGVVILILEKCSAELQWDPTWVFTTMLEIGIPFPVLHGIYDRLFKTKDPCWQAVNKPFHILEVIYYLLTKYVESPSLMPSYERPAFTTTLYDACAVYLVELESICSRDPTVQSILGKFKGLKTRLQRLL